MIANPDIYQVVRLLIERHGDGALLHAVRRADFLLEEGDFEGAAGWRQITAAIQELQREPP